MALEGKYVENGRCTICGKDWPHIHTLEEAFLYEARLFGSGMRQASATLEAENARLREALLLDAGRWADLAAIVEGGETYANLGFFRGSERRCRNVLAGGRYND